jgi:hypothetical protein
MSCKCVWRFDISRLRYEEDAPRNESGTGTLERSLDGDSDSELEFLLAPLLEADLCIGPRNIARHVTNTHLKLRFLSEWDPVQGCGKWPSHIHGGDLLPFWDLSLFLSQLVLEA